MPLTAASAVAPKYAAAGKRAPPHQAYKLLCPALRENLAAKVLRDNLAAQARTDIEPECPICARLETRPSLAQRRDRDFVCPCGEPARQAFHYHCAR
jgi:hypothetical protein